MSIEKGITMDIPEEEFILLSIDPSAANLGYSILGVNLETYKVTCYVAGTAHPAKDICLESTMTESFGARFAKMQQVEDDVARLLETYRPHGVALETNYMGRFANSFKSLTECVMSINKAIYNSNLECHVGMVSPSHAKAAVGADGRSKDKDAVRKALPRVTDLNLSHITLDDVSEHGVDSIAIGYAYVRLRYNNSDELQSTK